MHLNTHSDYYSEGENHQPPLFYTLITPETGKINATMLILHGMKEHSGRYKAVAEYFAENGLAVVIYDHIGHGKSVNNEDDLGFFQSGKPVDRLISDAEKMGKQLMEKYPDVPHFVLGHSMGSFVTRCLLARVGEDYDGVILSGTGGRLFGINLLNGYFSLSNKFFPRSRTFFNELFNSFNNWKFRKEKEYGGQGWLSLNPDNRKAFTEDELCGLPFTNNSFYTLFRLYKRATQKKWYRDIPKNLPFLFISGADDPIGEFGRGVKQAARDLSDDGFKKVDVKLYPKMRHEILNERIRDEVLEEVMGWVLQEVHKN